MQWLKGLVKLFGCVLFLKNWGCWFSTHLGCSDFCDNKSAIMLSSDSVLHERTKHIEVDVHFIREKVRDGIIIPIFVPSRDQIADMLTKPVGPSLLCDTIDKLNLLDIFAPA